MCEKRTPSHTDLFFRLVFLRDFCGARFLAQWAAPRKSHRAFCAPYASQKSRSRELYGLLSQQKNGWWARKEIRSFLGSCTGVQGSTKRRAGYAPSADVIHVRMELYGAAENQVIHSGCVCANML